MADPEQTGEEETGDEDVLSPEELAEALDALDEIYGNDEEEYP